MQFDDIYNVHCKLTLLCGRVITLDHLVQGRTYAGLMMGTPDKRGNDWLIEHHLEEAKALPISRGEPYLIQPLRRDYRRNPGDMQPVLDHQLQDSGEIYRIPEWMPEVYCIARFQSMMPVRAQHSSVLTVVWYQTEFGVDQTALEAVRALDWDSLATDLGWD